MKRIQSAPTISAHPPANRGGHRRWGVACESERVYLHLLILSIFQTMGFSLLFFSPSSFSLFLSSFFFPPSLFPFFSFSPFLSFVSLPCIHFFCLPRCRPSNPLPNARFFLPTFPSRPDSLPVLRCSQLSPAPIPQRTPRKSRAAPILPAHPLYLRPQRLLELEDLLDVLRLLLPGAAAVSVLPGHGRSTQRRAAPRMPAGPAPPCGFCFLFCRGGSCCCCCFFFFFFFSSSSSSSHFLPSAAFISSALGRAQRVLLFLGNFVPTFSAPPSLSPPPCSQL